MRRSPGLMSERDDESVCCINFIYCLSHFTKQNVAAHLFLCTWKDDDQWDLGDGRDILGIANLEVIGGDRSSSQQFPCAPSHSVALQSIFQRIELRMTDMATRMETMEEKMERLTVRKAA